MNKKPIYIKCPRCQLNYILKKDKFCEICKKEMRAGALKDEDEFDIDEIELLEEDELFVEPTLKKVWDDSDDEAIVEDEEDDIDFLPALDEDIDEELGTTFAKDLDDEFVDDEEEAEDFKTASEDDDEDDDFDLDELDDLDDLDDEEELEDDEEDDDDYDY